LRSDPLDHSNEFIHLEICPYGFSCEFLKQDDPQHCEKYSHPDKPKKEKEKKSTTIASCPNGRGCKLQIDPKHKEKYSHTIESPPISPVILCPEGITCLLLLRGDQDHIQRFNHNGQGHTVTPAPKNQVCSKGSSCKIALTSQTHAANFDHSGVVVASPSVAGSQQRPMCSNPYSCSQTSDIAHKQQFRHYCKNGSTCRNINDPVHRDRFVHQSV